MKYAHDLLGLMPAYPGRRWRMAELVRSVSGRREITRRERDAMRQAILRVLAVLEENGQVYRVASADNSVLYVWGKCDTDFDENWQKRDGGCDNRASTIAPSFFGSARSA